MPPFPPMTINELIFFVAGARLGLIVGFIARPRHAD